MPKTILIADDFVDSAALLEKKLKSEGFATLYAAAGEAAVRVAKANKPDLIICDIMMPKIGGTEVRVQLMKDPATREIPILFLTGLRPPNSKKPTVGVKVIGKS